MSQLLKRKCAGLFLGINPKGFNVVRYKSRFLNKERGVHSAKITAGLSRG